MTPLERAARSTETYVGTLAVAGSRRRRLLSLCCVAVVSALLTACATPGRIAGDGTAFERTGRFAVNVSEAGRPPEAVQGAFAWRDTGRALRLDLANPLGSTLARIQVQPGGAVLEHANGTTEDRKSTRLNSSHVKISYAVFCLKKKNETCIAGLD